MSRKKPSDFHIKLHLINDEYQPYNEVTKEIYDEHGNKRPRTEADIFG